MATITGVVKSPIQGRTGTLNRSSGYEYRDFWYKDANGKDIHVVGWHRALDITTLGTIVAFARGKVIANTKGVTGQTTNPSGGNQVTLEHANGSRSTYAHLDNGSNNHLSIGQIVEEGAVLGTDVKKTTGNSTGLHLHFGIYVGGAWVDPTPYLQGAKVLEGYGVTPTPNPSKTIDELAREVIAGKWGNNPGRKEALINAGYDYSAVQARVNEILAGNTPAPTPTPTPVEDDLLTLVKKTIRGDFGNGQTRKDALGHNYNKVMAQVNKNYAKGTTQWGNIRLY